MKFAEEKLTEKQKIILKRVLAKEETSSALAKNLSREIRCSRSAIFNNLNSLKRCGLVDGVKGQVLKLTEVGKIVSEKLGGEGNG